MKCVTLIFVILSLMALNSSCGRRRSAEGRKSVPVDQLWRGEIEPQMRREAPSEGYIASEEAWARLWRAYRGNEELPAIDFSKQVVLVGLGRDSGQVDIETDSSWAIPLENGNLKPSYTYSEAGPDNAATSKYVLVLIGREGVKMINGQSIGTAGRSGA
ncbi:MAG TPA: hypothetical protein VJ302_30460 [Blastocatellia bacterium]|nr:hypothetical protein [Blastocatellia bacterium]